MKKKRIDFLTLAEVVEIHRNQIELYGGADGVRDFTLLSSALAIPQATFNSDYLHFDLFDMAAAYAFHISQNHPFVDGNKRTALASALVFLDFNHIEIKDPKGLLYQAMIKIASGMLHKKDFAKILKKLSTAQIHS